MPDKVGLNAKDVVYNMVNVAVAVAAGENCNSNLWRCH
jgi:hypothetical protein